MTVEQNQFVDQIQSNGYAILPGVLPSGMLGSIRRDLEAAIEKEEEYRVARNVASHYGMVLLCSLYGGSLLEGFGFREPNAALRVDAWRLLYYLRVHVLFYAAAGEELFGAGARRLSAIDPRICNEHGRDDFARRLFDREWRDLVPSGVAHANRAASGRRVLRPSATSDCASGQRFLLQCPFVACRQAQSDKSLAARSHFEYVPALHETADRYSTSDGARRRPVFSTTSSAKAGIPQPAAGQLRRILRNSRAENVCTKV